MPSPSMASTELRPPCFSEDIAWMPGWLQQCQANSFEEFTKGSPATPSDIFDKFAPSRNIGERESRLLLLEEIGCYENCNLILSREDHSIVSMTPSPEPVLHLQLHLSSVSSTVSLSNPLVDVPQEVKPDTDNILSTEGIKTSFKKRDMGNQFHMNCKTVEALNSSPLTSGPRSLNSSCFNCKRNARRKRRSKCNVGFHGNVEIDHSVELSVSASEALVIHDLVKNGSFSTTLSAAAVLEVALKLKQARLIWVEDASHSDRDEVDDGFDFLADLDESTLAEAFEDVGLSVICYNHPKAGTSLMSQVKETPNTANLLEFNNEIQHFESGPQDMDFVSNSIREDTEDDIHTSSLLVRALSAENPELTEEIKVLDKSPNADSAANFRAQVEGVGLTIKETISLLPCKILDTSRACNSNAREEDNVPYLGPKRFSSRWFGGWTVEEIEDRDEVKLNNTTTIPQVYVGETSILSESADVAPDENSIVHRDETHSMRASQSSIARQGSLDEFSKETVVSQEIVRSSGLSLLDPLCSVVPSSIPSETAGPLQHSPCCPNWIEDFFGRCCSTEILMEDKTSDPTHNLVDEDELGSASISGNPLATVSGNMTSLKRYNMVLPDLKILEMENHKSPPNECKSGMILLNHNKGDIKSCVKTNFEKVQPSSCNFNVGNNSEGYGGSFFINDPSTQIMLKLRNLGDEHLPEIRSSPKVLNNRCRLQADDHFVNKFSIEANQENAEVQGGLVKFQHETELQMPHLSLQSKTNILNECYTEENDESAAAQNGLAKFQHQNDLQEPQLASKNPCDMQVPIRKQVRFMEAENDLLLNKQIKKQWLIDGHCQGSHSNTLQKVKTSNLLPESGSQEVKRRLTNCRDKGGRKLVFQGIEFLLTGFSTEREKQLERLIRKYGGIVLLDIPSPSKSRGKRSSKSIVQNLPVVLSRKKLETTKFLYGCAINAYILKVNWLMDCVASRSLLPPDRYLILSSEVDGNMTSIRMPLSCYRHEVIFERVGVMLRGKQSFINKLSKIFKHGGGSVFKTLHWLAQSLDTGKISMGAIVIENRSMASRHLRHCASERNIAAVSSSWIIRSLQLRKLLPFTESDDHCFPFPRKDANPGLPISIDVSEEI